MQMKASVTNVLIYSQVAAIELGGCIEATKNKQGSKPTANMLTAQIESRGDEQPNRFFQRPRNPGPLAPEDCAHVKCNTSWVWEPAFQWPIPTSALEGHCKGQLDGSFLNTPVVQWHPFLLGFGAFPTTKDHPQDRFPNVAMYSGALKGRFPLKWDAGI